MTTATSTPLPLATQLLDEVEYGEKGMFRKILVKNQRYHAMLICLMAGIRIPEHISTYPGFITILEGKGTFLLAGQDIQLEPGVFIELPAHTLHSLTVTENLVLLKVVDSHEFSATGSEEKKGSCRPQTLKPQSKVNTYGESMAKLLQPYVP